MLLRFAVSNHLSIRDEQELSFVASSLKDSESGTFECRHSPTGRLLTNAIIYGANASGKSNLISALSFMRSAALGSHQLGEPGEKIPRQPFMLDAAMEGEPSKFEIEFVSDDIRYQYGFSAIDDCFNEEWLYSYSKNRRQTLMERDGQSFTFGRTFKGQNKVISELCRENSLFLSAAYQNDHETVSHIANYFKNIHIRNTLYVTGEMISSSLKDQDISEEFLKILDLMGTGIIDYKKDEVEYDEKTIRLISSLNSTLKEIFGESSPDLMAEGGARKQPILQLGHKSKTGQAVFLDIDRESAGTRRLLYILGPILRALKNGTPIVIDELDASLHTKACEQIIRLFCIVGTNPNNSQLIATTHDTNLLHINCLRRDHIWFTEKDEDGATHLYPLTDFYTRQADNIEKGYLQGRYGAIPFAGNPLA